MDPLIFTDSIHQSHTAIEFNPLKYSGMYDGKSHLLPKTLLPEAKAQLTLPTNLQVMRCHPQPVFISNDLLIFTQDLNTSPPPRKPQHNVKLNMCLKQERCCTS